MFVFSVVPTSTPEFTFSNWVGALVYEGASRGVGIFLSPPEGGLDLVTNRKGAIFPVFTRVDK